MESASSDVSNIHLQKRQRTEDKSEDKTRSAMLALDVLDCPICVEPFTVPIFQCDNGHLACATCCPKLRNKCPQCAFPIGHSRCRGMESVLESILVPCPNAKLGCTKNITYGKESSHEKECSFSLCSCPVQDCKYTGSYKNLYKHYIFSTHLKNVSDTLINSFGCGNSFDVRMNISEIRIIMEHRERLLFALQCFREVYGVFVTVSCIAPSAPEVGEFSYHITYIVDGNSTITFQLSEVKRLRELSFQRPGKSFILIPNCLVVGEMVEMKICIKKLNRE